MKHALVSLTGYDPSLVVRLVSTEQRFFVGVGILCVVASALVGAGAGYGGMYSFSAPVGVGIGVVFAALVLNLFRLLHAGTGYPVHLPIEGIDGWRPGKAPALVLWFLGALIAQPIVILLLKPWLDPLIAARGDNTDGLIIRTLAAWDMPLAAAPLTVVLAFLIAAPAWTRILTPDAVRAYERERWIEDRLLVDDAFADAQNIITSMLDGLKGFSGTLATHTADPPYNTRPLVYGLDPALIESGSVRFVKGRDVPLPEPAPRAPAPAPVAAPLAPTPLAAAPPPLPAPAPVAAAPAATATDDEINTTWDDPAHDDDPNPPALAFFDIGRLQVKRARAHMDVAAPFIAQFTDRPEDEVRALLKNAPDDARVHRLFGDYKKLRSILMKDAHFALAHGLAPVVALITQRSVADVDKRLRAAPPDKRLTGVFAPELARRLLKRKP